MFSFLRGILRFACESGIERIITSLFGETVRHMYFPVANRAIRLLSKLIWAPGRCVPRRKSFQISFATNLGQAVAPPERTYYIPAISYGRRFRPITLTRLTRGIQSANVRGGLRLRSLAALRARSRRTMRGESFARSAYTAISVHNRCSIKSYSWNVRHRFLARFSIEVLSVKMWVIRIPDVAVISVKDNRIANKIFMMLHWKHWIIMLFIF